MAVMHSCSEEKSLFDLVCLRADGEQWRDEQPAVVQWLAGDGVTAEVKSDEMALSTGNLFMETGRTSGEATGVNISASQRWFHLLGQVALVMDTDRLRDGVEKLVAWERARLLPGGDKNGTLGAAVPVLDCLAAPVAAEELSARTPVRVWEVRFADGTPAKAAFESAASGLKTADSAGMNWGRDRSYGELGESYLGQMLAELPLQRTLIQELPDIAFLGRRPGGTWSEPVLNMAWRAGGELVGVASSQADIWLVELPGVVILAPVAFLKKLARMQLRAGAGRVHPRHADVDIIPMPLADRRASDLPGGKPVPYGIPFCAGSALPDGLPAFPEASPQLTAAAAA